MFQVSMDFYFSIEQLKAGTAEIFQLNHFDGISLQFFAFLDSFVYLAAVSTS